MNYADWAIHKSKVRKLTYQELRELTYCSIEDIHGDAHRWQREVTSIIKLEDGRYFAVEWMEGLTEMQENSDYCQPYEVKLVTKTVEITSWEAV